MLYSAGWQVPGDRVHSIWWLVALVAKQEKMGRKLFPIVTVEFSRMFIWFDLTLPCEDGDATYEVKSTYEPIVAHKAGWYPGFYNMKRLGVFLLPPSSIKFACTHLYSWVERGTVRTKCLSQEHNTIYVPGQGLNPDRSLRSLAH